jgi:hypothetical protein
MKHTFAGLGALSSRGLEEVLHSARLAELGVGRLVQLVHALLAHDAQVGLAEAGEGLGVQQADSGGIA